MNIAQSFSGAPRATWLRSQVTSTTLLRVGVWLTAIAIFVTPLGLIVSLALGGNQLPTLRQQGLAEALWNSLTSTIVSSLSAVILGCVLAVLLERTDIGGRTGLRILFLSPMLVPPFVGAISWLQLFGRNQGFNRLLDGPIWDIYGADGVIFLMTLHSYPVVYVILAAALKSIPGDLESAAKISGASHLTVIRTVTLPLLFPAILSSFTLTVVSNLADFGIPSILGSPVRYETLATMVYRIMESGTVDKPLQATSAVGAVLLLLGIVAVIADRLVAEHTGSTMEKSAAPTFGLGRGKNVCTAALWLAALSLTIAPLTGLAYRALLPAPGVAFTPENISLNNFEAVIANPRVVDGFVNSGVLAGAAAVLCGFLGWTAGLIVVRTRSRSNAALALIILLPTALPGLVVGVGWVIYGRYLDLYNSRWVILLAYICAFTALVLQAVRGPLKNVPLSVEEAARVSGSSQLRALLDTTGRMAVPAAVSGAVLVGLTAVRELTVSILLIAPGTTTIGVQLFNLQQSGNYNQACALALLFTVAGVLVLALTVRGRKRGGS